MPSQSPTALAEAVEPNGALAVTHRPMCAQIVFNGTEPCDCRPIESSDQIVRAVPPKGRASMTGIVAPSEREFMEQQVDFLSARAMQDVAEDLIATYPELSHLKSARIAYLWKRSGGQSKGQATLGKCQKPSGLLAHFAGVDYVVWLAADHARDHALTALQLEALVFHELMHTDVEDHDEAEDVVFTMRGHDVEEHSAVVRRYGLWRDSLTQFAAEVRQLSLSEAQSS